MEAQHTRDIAEDRSPMHPDATEKGLDEMGLPCQQNAKQLIHCQLRLGRRSVLRKFKDALKDFQGL